MKYNYKYLKDQWLEGYANFIIANIDKPLVYNKLVMNPNISLDIINANPEIDWNWELLSYCKYISLESIVANLDKPWNWDTISTYPNITWDFINANLDIPWNWTQISMHPNITEDIIEKNINKKVKGKLIWKWGSVSKNKNITEIQTSVKRSFRSKSVCSRAGS